MESVGGSTLKKMMLWRRRRGRGKKYRRVEKEEARVVRLGGEARGGRRRIWRIKKAVRIRTVKPWRLWRRVKEAYVNMMVGLAGRVGCLNEGADFFGSRRVPMARRKLTTKDSSLEEFEKRLVVEIYNSMLAFPLLRSVSPHSFL